MSNQDKNGCWHKYDNKPFPMILLIHLLIKFVFINSNDPNEPVYIYNFQHSTVYIQTFFYKCNALLSYIIYLICKFVLSFISIFHQKIENCIQC